MPSKILPTDIPCGMHGDALPQVYKQDFLESLFGGMVILIPLRSKVLTCGMHAMPYSTSSKDQ